MRLFLRRHWTAIAVGYAVTVCATAAAVLWTVPQKPVQKPQATLAASAEEPDEPRLPLPAGPRKFQ
jgi:hypothetical protein